VEYRRLGNTHQRISRLGFGCVQASGYDYGPIESGRWTAAIQAALDDGVNLFDVADVYGFGGAERMLAAALGQKRHDVVIATKGGVRWDQSGHWWRDTSPAYLRQAVDESLKRLRLDTIPLYQLHWPDEKTPLEDSLQVLADCQRQGKILHIGVSHFSLADLQRARSFGFRIDSVQEIYNLLSREVEDGLLDDCTSTATAFLAHTPLARGLLAGKRSIGPGSALSDTRSRSGYFSPDAIEQKTLLLDGLRSVSGRAHVPCGAVAIRWILDEPRVASVLVGVKTCEQWKDNFRAFECSLEPGEREQLSLLAAKCPRNLAGSPAHASAAPRL
jgi:aryl-alcohol dehydrogenase-like predicted oxidoreductase